MGENVEQEDCLSTDHGSPDVHGDEMPAEPRSGARDVNPGELTMGQFEQLMAFVKETRALQQQYLETIRSENQRNIENARQENLRLIERIERSLGEHIRDNKESFAEYRDSLKYIGSRLENQNKFFWGIIASIWLAVLIAVLFK